MKSILKQTSWLFLAQASGRVIGFFYTIFLARNLGVSDFGLLTVALAYFSLVSAISDLGLNQFLIRELARNRKPPTELISNIAMIRLTLASSFFAVFAVGLYLFDQDKMRVSLTLLSLLAIVPQSVALTFDAIFVSIKKLQFSAISLFISSLTTVLVGTYLVGLGLGPIGAINALIFGQIIYLAVLVVFLYKYRISPLSSVKLSVIKKALMGALPYGVLGILGLLYFKVDSILLSYLRGSFETGLYGAAYRFLEATVFIPNALGLALFPVLTKLHDMQPQQIKSLYFKSMRVMLIVALAIVIAYLTILPIIIKVLLPSFLPAIEAIKILAWAIPFIFLHIPASSVVLSTEKYLGKLLLFSLIPLTFNILMNLKFIPLYGFIAASWITVASDALSFLIIFFFIQRYIFKNV